MKQKITDEFDDKVLLITGGTGSFGHAVLKRFVYSDIGEIRIFSRDEKKQDDLRHELQKDYPSFAQKVKFYIGDVRDKSSLDKVMRGVDYIFHASALKQVPSCEFFPIEAVKTNVLGTENVLNSAIEHNVNSVVLLSTDKAVYPISAMGMTKAIMEKVALAKARDPLNSSTRICCTRYGNVLCTRGSVVPLWIEQIKNNQPITITNSEMTRFMMTINDAVDLVLYTFKNGQNGDIMVQKMPSCSLQVLATALKNIFSSDVPIKVIGARHGEKLDEVLLTSQEFASSWEYSEFFRVPLDKRNLNYDVAKAKTTGKICEDYTSKSTKILSVEEVEEILKQEPFVIQELANR